MCVCVCFFFLPVLRYRRFRISSLRLRGSELGFRDAGFKVCRFRLEG